MFFKFFSIRILNLCIKNKKVSSKYMLKQIKSNKGPYLSVLFWLHRSYSIYAALIIRWCAERLPLQLHFTRVFPEFSPTTCALKKKMTHKVRNHHQHLSLNQAATLRRLWKQSGGERRRQQRCTVYPFYRSAFCIGDVKPPPLQK